MWHVFKTRVSTYQHGVTFSKTLSKNLDENVGVLATVSMFVVMDVYDSQGKQIHAPWGVAV